MIASMKRKKLSEAFNKSSERFQDHARMIEPEMIKEEPIKN